MATLRILFNLLITALVVLVEVNAGQVVWSSERMATNVTSTRTQLGDDFRFELGGFADGFEPTSANVADWRANWAAVGSAEYNARLGFFAASTAIEVQTSELGDAAYIWGFNRESVSGDAEWVLLTNPAWLFPANVSGIAPPEQWSTGTATLAVVGSVNAEPGVHLQTAAVGGVSEGAVAWLASFGLSHNGDTQIWEEDTDGDGVSNLLEYATGTHPLVASSFSRETVYLATYEDSRALTLTFDKNPHARVHYQIELSSDLNHWESGDDSVEVVSDTPDQMTVRDSLPLDTAGSRFFRLSVSLLP